MSGNPTNNGKKKAQTKDHKYSDLKLERPPKKDEECDMDDFSYAVYSFHGTKKDLVAKLEYKGTRKNEGTLYLDFYKTLASTENFRIYQSGQETTACTSHELKELLDKLYLFVRCHYAHKFDRSVKRNYRVYILREGAREKENFKDLYGFCKAVEDKMKTLKITQRNMDQIEHLEVFKFAIRVAQTCMFYVNDSGKVFSEYEQKGHSGATQYAALGLFKDLEANAQKRRSKSVMGGGPADASGADQVPSKAKPAASKTQSRGKQRVKTGKVRDHIVQDFDDRSALVTSEFDKSLAFIREQESLKQQGRELRAKCENALSAAEKELAKHTKELTKTLSRTDKLRSAIEQDERKINAKTECIARQDNDLQLKTREERAHVQTFKDLYIKTHGYTTNDYRKKMKHLSNAITKDRV